MKDELIFQLISSANDLEIYKLEKKYCEEKKLPWNTYIARSAAMQDVLFSPHIGGILLQSKMKRVGEMLVKAITEVALKNTSIRKIVEVVYLSGGLFYYLNHGFKKVHKFAVPQCFIGIQRSRIEGTEGQFTAKIGYENFEALPENATVVIGDTIATGATMCKGLLALESALKERNYTPKKIVITTLAGATEGMQNGANLSLMLDGHVSCYVPYDDSCGQFITKKNMIKALIEFFNLRTELKPLSALLEDYIAANRDSLTEQELSELSATKMLLEALLSKTIVTEHAKEKYRGAVAHAVEFLRLKGIITSERISPLNLHEEFAKFVQAKAASHYVYQKPNEKIELPLHGNVFIIGSITNVPSDSFTDHLAFKMALTNMLRFRHGLNPMFALLDNEINLDHLPQNLRPLACYYVDQLCVDEAGLVIAIAGPSLGTGLELGRSSIRGVPVIMLRPNNLPVPVPHQILGMPNIAEIIDYDPTDTAGLSKCLVQLDKLFLKNGRITPLREQPISTVLARIYRYSQHIELAERFPNTAGSNIEQKNMHAALTNLKTALDSLLTFPHIYSAAQLEEMFSKCKVFCPQREPLSLSVEFSIGTSQPNCGGLGQLENLLIRRINRTTPSVGVSANVHLRVPREVQPIKISNQKI